MAAAALDVQSTFLLLAPTTLFHRSRKGKNQGQNRLPAEIAFFAEVRRVNREGHRQPPLCPPIVQTASALS